MNSSPLPVSGPSRSYGLIRWAAVVAMIALVGCASPIDKGIRMEQEGRYEDAIALYRSIASEKPGTPDALRAELRIAEAYMTNLKEPEKAVETYQRIAQESPTSEEGLTARYQLALYYFRNEQYNEAAKEFQGIVNDVPTTERGANAQLMLAKSYEKAGELEQAEKTYGAFSALHTQDTKAALALETRAQLLEKLGKKAEAISARQKLVQDYGANAEATEVVSMAKEGLKAEGAKIPKPKTPETASRGERLMRQRENIRQRDLPQSAKASAEERMSSSVFGVSADAIMQSMQVRVDSQGTMYDAMFSMAQVMYSSEQYKKAGALYQRSIELASEEKGSSWENLGAALKGLSDVYRKLGLEEKARETLLAAMRKNPKVLDQIIDSGLVDYGSGDYQKAIATWTSIIGINPGRDTEIYYNIGQAYKKLGDTPNEVSAFEHAVAASPQNEDAVQSLAEALYYRAGQRKRSYLFQDLIEDKAGYETYEEIARLALRYGYYMTAQIQFSIGARLAKNDGKPDIAAGLEALKAVAKGKRNANLVEEATQELQPILDANPDNALVRYAAGLHAVTRGDMDTAIAELKKALELDPKSYDTIVALAGVYVSQDEIQAAIDAYDAYLGRNPRDRDVQQRRDALKVQLGMAEGSAAPATTNTATSATTP